MKLKVSALLGAVALIALAAPACAQVVQYQSGDGINNTPVSTATPMPVTCTSGCSVTVGAVTVADGADADQGAKADSVCSTATGTCTISALIKYLNSIASTTSGPYTGSITNTAVAVDASAGTLWGYYFYNPNASACYVQFWNTAQGSVTVGTTAPILSLAIPATGAANVQFAVGHAFSTAITIAATTARAGGTACGSNIDANVWYK